MTRSFESFMGAIGTDEVPFVETTCLLWFSILEHGGGRAESNTWHEGKVDRILKKHVDSLSKPQSWFDDALSQIVARQTSLRHHQIALKKATEGEDELWEWHLDLGFVRQIAFAPEVVWSDWLLDMKQLLLAQEETDDNGSDTEDSEV